MTVASLTNQIEYAGDDATVAFPIPFRFPKNADIRATLISTTDVPTAQVITTNYTLSGADDDAGGTLTMNTPPATGEKLDIRRWVDFLQAKDFETNGPFPLDEQEFSLDILTMMVQQLAETLGASAYSFEKTSVMTLLSTDAEAWDAQSKQLSNVLDPVVDQDAATKAFVEATVTGTGQMPPSTAADDILVGNGTAFIVKTAEQFVAIYAGDGLEADGSGNFQLDLQASGGLEFNTNEVRCAELLRDIANLTVVEGDILYVDASGDIVKLVKGTLDNVLTQTATIPAWAAPSSLDVSLPPEYITGFKMTNDAGDTAHDIEIGTGSCRNDDDDLDVSLAAVITKKIDVAWAEGDDQGGMATGAVANDTWYHMWLITEDADQTNVDVTFDVSTTGANAPVGWTAERRVGSVLTDGSANIINFTDMGNGRRMWDTPIEDFDGTISASSQTLTMSSPVGFRTEAIFSVGMIGPSAERLLKVYSTEQSDQTPSATAAPGMNLRCGNTLGADDSATQMRLMTDTSSQLEARADGVTTTLRIWTDGYVDFRGTS